MGNSRISKSRFYLRMVCSSFLRRWFRVFVASLSVLVGAATLSGLTIMTYLVPQEMAKELRSFGANLIVSGNDVKPMNETQLTKVDQELNNQHANVLGSAAYRYDNLLYRDQPVPVMGTEFSRMLKVRTYLNIEGKLPSSDKQVLIGSDLAKKYLWEIGSKISLANKESQKKPIIKDFTVAGVIRSGGQEDGLVVISLPVLNKLLGNKRIDFAEYSVVGDSAVLRSDAETINQRISSVDAQVVKRITQSENGILDTLRSLILIVSIIVCVLTMIGVSTTMNSMVSERASEIGLKKALGSSNKSIIGEFLGEAVALGLFGGLVGAAGGIAIAKLVSEQVFHTELGVHWVAFPITMVISALISCLGSLIPVSKISTISPATVLGGE